MRKPKAPALLHAAWDLAHELGRVEGHEAEQEAVNLCLATLAYVTGDSNFGWTRGRELRAAIERAHSAFTGGAKATKYGDVLANVEEAARLGARLGWPAAAALLARELGQPARRVPELARRLEAHYVAPKSGRVPRGRYTTAMIAAWLTEDLRIAKHASRTGKRQK